MGNFGKHPFLVGTCMFSLNSNFNLPTPLPSNPIPFPINNPTIYPPLTELTDMDSGIHKVDSYGTRTGSVEKRGQETAPLTSILKPHEISSPPRKQARKRNIKLSNNFFAKEVEKGNWQKFFIVNKKEGDFKNVSPFSYCNDIVAAIGKPKNVKRLSSGALNIEAVSPEQAGRLLQLHKLRDHEVTVTPNKRLNTSQGVIVCRDFLVCTEEEIKQGLADQGVIEVRRINRRQAGSLIATASLVLTFDRPQPPEQVEAAFYKLKVRRYIPSPMRCYQCLKFGHTSLRCRLEGQMCACGMLSHEGLPCRDPPICVNCAGAHNARAPECPTFIDEKEIQKLKVLQNMSYPEARALVSSRSYVKTNRPYAVAAKSVPEKEKVDWEKLIRPHIYKTAEGPQAPVWTSNSAISPPVPKEALTPPPIPETAVVVKALPSGGRDTTIPALPSTKEIAPTETARQCNTPEAQPEPVAPKQKGGSKKGRPATAKSKQEITLGEMVLKTPSNLVKLREVDCPDAASTSQPDKTSELTPMIWERKYKDDDGDVSESGDSCQTNISGNSGKPLSDRGHPRTRKKETRKTRRK